MPSVALACLVALLVSTLVGRSAAQDLRERLDAAAARQGQAEIANLLAAPAPLPPIVDALVADQGRTGWQRARPFQILVETRRAEVEALWRREPELRIRRAELFAALGGTFVLDRHAAGDFDEQADAVEVARFLLPAQWCFLGAMFDERQPLARRRSAKQLHRAVVNAARQQPRPLIQNLRRVHGTTEELDRAGLWLGDGLTHVSPFELVELLGDDEPIVRRRAMAMLRLTLGLPLPGGLAEALRCDPSASVRGQASRGPMTAAEVDWMIASLAAGEAPVPQQPIDTSRLSPKDVERLAAALIAAATRRPIAARIPMGPVGGGPGGPRNDQPPPTMFTPRDGYAEKCFAAAAGLGPRFTGAVLAAAVQAAAPEVALRALHGFAFAQAWIRHVDAATADAAAPLVLVLLDHADPEVQLAATRAAWSLVAAAPVPALRERVVAMAQHGLANSTLRSERHRDSWCGNGPPSQPCATCMAAAAVGAASAAGDQRITNTLLRRWLEPWRGEDPGFTLLCLARLAPGMAPDVARELHQRLAARWSPDPGNPFWDECPEAHAMHALFVAVPDDVLPWYRDVFADKRCRIACAHAVCGRSAAIPVERVQLLLGPLAADDTIELDVPARLYLHAPERVAAAWHRDGNRARHAQCIVSTWWRTDAEKVESLVAAGTLSRALAASAINGDSPVHPGLERLARIAPAATETSTAWIGPFVFAIENAPAAARDADVAALEALAESPHAALVLAVARRATTLGPGGMHVARTALSRLLPVADRASRNSIVALCAATGVRPDGLESAVASMRGSVDWYAQMLADAADLRFFGLHPAATKSGYAGDAIGAARIDLDALSLHCALRGGAGRELELQRLLPSCSPVTMVSALELAKDVRMWGSELQKCVTSATLHDDPRIRRAAYLALRSRDRDVDPLWWLACEAAFDPDPSVRDAAR